MPRSIWKGNVSFGLVTIAIELVSMEAPERLDLDLLDRRDMAHIGYQKINKSTGEPVPNDEIVRGFEVEREEYVILTPEDLRAANPTASRTIEISGFLPIHEVPPVYLARPYLLVAGGGSDKAYALLRDTMEETGQAALATVVIRTRQYVCLLFPYQGALVAQMLRYHDELRLPARIDLEPPEAEIKPAEAKMARQLVESMATAWHPEDWHDAYRDDLLKLVKRKAKQGSRAAREVPEEEAEPRVLDLTAALKRSVAEQGGKRVASKRRRSAAKR